MIDSEWAMLVGKYLVVPLVGAAVGVGAKEYFEDRRFLRLRRQRPVFGRWQGKLSFLTTGDAPQAIAINVASKGWWEPGRWLNPKMLTGTIERENGQVDFQGGFYKENVLLLDYRARDPSIFQFGSVLLTLDAGARTLNGLFVGWYNEPFAGSVVLTKAS